MLVMIGAKYGKNQSRIVCAVKRTQDMAYFSSFITKSWLNDVEDESQGQRSLHMTHHLMLVIICAKEGKHLSRTVHAAERTRQDVPYFSSFIAKSWQNDLGDIGQGQKSLCRTHPLMPMINSAQYGKNPSRTVHAVKRTQQMWHILADSFSKSWLNDLQDTGQGQRVLYAQHTLAC